MPAPHSEFIFLSHCGLSPLYPGSRKVMHELIDYHASQGDALFRDHYMQTLDEAHTLFGQYFNTRPENIAMVRNTTEAMSMIANGYPWEEGDELVLYEHEYPANFYPWVNQRSKGVRIRTLRNHMPFHKIPTHLPGRWDWEELERTVNDKTRMIVMSHVQFVSGFAADLEKLGQYCADRNIDFIVDGAQSIGALPIDVEKFNIAGLSGSGWKWMRGPMGIAPFFTSPALREKMALTIVGAETMVQGTDFLNHDWNPHQSARRYEYATSSAYLVAGLNRALKEVFLVWDSQQLIDRLVHLQDHFLHHLNRSDFIPLLWAPENRSGILSLFHPRAEDAVAYLYAKGIVVSSRGGFIRIAPHYYNSEVEMEYLAENLNKFI